ncbi:hypothetical protein [Streptomyces sp. NPDC001536]|uniref:hypothetical protein n=1 Tax=Streptomyces sp. NPDC001536 TaxID=3364583 RepID=UPI003673F00B
MPSTMTVPTTATAAEIATAALAEWGITAHLDVESLIGGHKNTWLIIGSDQSDDFPDMRRPYVVLYVYTDPSDEIWVDKPIESRFDSWHVVVGDGTGPCGGEHTAFTARTPGIAEVAEFIAGWLTAPQP